MESAVAGRIADEARAGLYGILGRLYDQEVTPELAEEAQRSGFFETVTEASPGLEGHGAPDLETLAVEFARLFIGPTPLAPPYASVHRTDEERAGQLWGVTTGEAKRFMAHYGLDLAKPGTIPDHLSVQFEFMAKVIQAGIDATARGDEEAHHVALGVQRQFFSHYIDPWLDAFLHRVQKAQPMPFYRAVASVTESFIADEREVLGPQPDSRVDENTR